MLGNELDAWRSHNTCLFDVVGVSGTGVVVLLPDFWGKAMSAAQIKVFHNPFKDGRESVESDLCSRRPATNRTPENVEHVQASITKDQRTV